MSQWFPALASGASIALMGACAVQLIWRLWRVLRGQERMEGLPAAPQRADARMLWLSAGAALLSRAAVYALGYVLYRVFAGGEASFAASFEALWTHWDARHYIGIAEEGYTAVGDGRLRLVFFPLYPLLMRLIAPLTGGSAFYAGTVISLGCSAGCAALLCDLASMHGGRETARRAVAYFLLSPMSVFLCCVYTEALFLCLTLGAVCLLRRGHPWLAALCGMASAFTRMPGVIIAGLFAAGLIGRMPREGIRPRDVLRCAGQMALVLAGLVAYWGINWFVTGDPLMYMTYQRENWFQQPGTFWDSVANTADYFLRTVGEDDWLYTWGFQLLCMGYTLALMVCGLRRLPLDLAGYSVVYVAVVLAPTWLLSGPRYLYALCTLPLLQAGVRGGRGLHAVALLCSGALLILFTFGYVIAVAVL